jgi:TetR/AcrR family tetracycline transcriptional repressor
VSESGARAEPLTREQVVDAALRLAARDGIAGLTMRALAGELGVTTMAPYHHVPGKRALLELVADSVLARIASPIPDPTRWEEQVKEVADEFLDEVGRYPGLAEFLLEGGLRDQGRRLVRAQLDVLRAAGFDETEVHLAYATVHTYMFGRLLVATRARRGSSVRRASPGSKEPDAPWIGLPSSAWSDYGLGTVLAGLRARLAERG